jgi:hypothetical protein
MDTIYCLVDAHGIMHVADGADSYAVVAAQAGIVQSECAEYRFDLGTRCLTNDRESRGSRVATQPFVTDRFGTAERLIAFAAEGHLRKPVLAGLLKPQARAAFADACTAVERRLTKACTDSGDPCLASGCALEGEVCLEPLLVAGIGYRKACAAQWAELFSDPNNRVEVWAQ